MSKKFIVAAVLSLFATAGLASEAPKKNPASRNTAMPTACTCALDETPAPVVVPRAEKVPPVVIKQPKVQSNIDLHPEDYR
jgi:hypothetical protein